MQNEPSGSVIPVPCQHAKGSWPTCYGYLRGSRPSEREILWARGNMADYCERNELCLARIFHDWEVAPNLVDYLGFRHALAAAERSTTHSLLLGDLDSIRTPSRVLDILANAIEDAIEDAMPHLRVRCLVDVHATTERRLLS